MPLLAQKFILSERFKLIFLLLLVYSLLALSQVTWRVDNVFYDAHMKYWQKPESAETVIIAIDEESLRKLGRWPWSRHIHAQLIDRLTQSNAKAVVLDLIFSEADTRDPEGDRALAAAIASNGRVILPVLVEQNRLQGQLIETMPLPHLAQAAAAMGHVHIELDQDGIARSTYLKEGLGKPYWPNISLALNNYLYGEATQELPGRRKPGVENSLNAWSRDYQVLIPYSGPPGHFTRVSYAQVLEDDFPLNLLQDKIVFVGATATGLGDVLPTPVSGQRHAMPGVEINTNIFQAIRNNKLIEPVSLTQNYWVYFVMVLLPVVLYPLLTPRNAILMALGLIVATAIFCIALLRIQQIWLPPMGAIITILSSYPLWSWRRLEFTIKSLNEELSLLNEEKNNLSIDVEKVKASEFEILGRFLSISVLQIFQNDDQLLEQFSLGKSSEFEKKSLFKANFSRLNSRIRCEYSRLLDSELNPDQLIVLEEFVLRLVSFSNVPKSTVETVERRIGEVKDTTLQLRRMQQFVRDSLEQMPDGIVITNQFGTIVNINKRAYELLQLNEKKSLQGQHILVIKTELENLFKEDLMSLVVEVLGDYKSRQKRFDLAEQKQVLVNITPFFDHQGMTLGLIISFTDISEVTRQQKQKEELINFLSHDLRTPLVSALAQLELARKQVPDAVNWNSLLERQYKLNQKTLNLAEEFVQLTRAENLNSLSFQSLNLIDAVDNAIDGIWAMADTKHIQIASDYAEPFIEVMGDFDLLERVVQNLLSNAIKYSPAETCVTVSVSMQNNSAILCVADQGYGIAPKDLDSLFTRFKRLTNSQHNKESGAGLGLAFVKTTVEKHGALISVKSEPGKGSRFCITFPKI